MRNIILTASLFLTASIAFAQVKAQPGTTPTTVTNNYYEINDIQEVIDKDTGATKTNYTWTIKPYTGNDKHGGSYNISATVVRSNTDGFTYTVFDAGNTKNEWKQEISVKVNTDGTVKGGTNLVSYRDVYDYIYTGKDSDGTPTYKKGDFLHRVYYFSIPIGEIEYWQKDEDGNYVLSEAGQRIPLSELKYPVTELGVMMGDDKISTDNSTTPSIFYRVSDQQYYLSFGKPVIDSQSNKIIRNGDTQIAFGQPLPAPLATLLIALSFGAAFVIYRNRKQAKA